MGKADRLKEAKKKINAEVKEGTLQFEVKIRAFQDGTIDVLGPIEDPILMLHIFAQAMSAIANHNLPKTEEKEEAESLILQ